MAVFYFSLETSIIFLLYFCKVNLEEQYYHLYELTLYLRVVFCVVFFFLLGFLVVQNVFWGPSMFKLVLEKAEEPEIKLPTSVGLWKKQESSRKTSISALLTMPKPLTMWIIINWGKFWKRWEYQTTGPASWEIYMQVRKQQLELDMEQQTGSK